MFVKFGKEFRLDIGNNYLNVEVSLENWCFFIQFLILLLFKRLKASHTCYQALGPDMIHSQPVGVYKSSTQR